MRAQRSILIVAVALGVAYLWLSGAFVGLGSSPEGATVVATPPGDAAPASLPGAESSALPRAQSRGVPSQAPKEGLALATFAAGCFWCTEADFDKVAGVVSTTSGYTGGRVPNPTYRQVSDGGTGHAEAVEIVFDPAAVTYEALLDHFWRNVDPFAADRQFCDRGNQYRPEIFAHDQAQRAAAEASKEKIQQRFRQRIVVEISNAGPFYRAEEYHQDYYKKNSAQYRFYRFGCGRDARLAEIWAST